MHHLASHRSIVPEADSLYRPQYAFAQTQLATCRIGYRSQGERGNDRQVLGILQQFLYIFGSELGHVTQSIRTLGRIFASLQLLDKQVYIRMVVVQRFFAARAQRENRKSKEYEQHSLPEYM